MSQEWLLVRRWIGDQGPTVPVAGHCERGSHVLPENEVEAALVVQMACTHSAAMSVLGRLGPAGGTEDRACRFAAAAARLWRAFTTQFERTVTRYPDARLGPDAL
jgi:hypothetical protein